MPHSSGGGSHGGGSHGGGSHGSSSGSNGTRISNHYFYGARCYRRHYRDGRHEDEYVYANRTPGKATLAGTIILCAIAVFFLVAMGSSIGQDMPKKLKPVYIDKPAVYDEFELIDNDDELVQTLKEYQEVTGICPVIYTTVDEVWINKYADLESYAYDMYVTNFSDEQHFVIVYSVPVEQAIGTINGTVTVPDYSWEAIQGDETDPIITSMLFKVFADRVQDQLESGANPGAAFNFAFTKAISDAESIVKPGGTSWMLKLASSATPMLVIAGVFIPMIIFSIRTYVKFRGVEYEEVPIDHDPESGAKYVSVTESAANAQGSPTSTFSGTSSGTGDSGSVATVGSEARSVISIVSTIFIFVFLTPFYLAGIGTVVGGIVMISKGQGPEIGYYLLGFGIVWTGLLVFITGGLFKNLLKNAKKKKEDTPEPVSYPTTEYPRPVYSQPETQTQNQTQPLTQTPVQEQPEFDQQFFSQQKSNYEEDDEEYKRMKRRGFE